VDTNDVLYYEDPLYEEELAEITAIVVDMLVTCLDQDDDKVQPFIENVFPFCHNYRTSCVEVCLENSFRSITLTSFSLSNLMHACV
jgi:hypothetical protein